MRKILRPLCVAVGLCATLPATALAGPVPTLSSGVLTYTVDVNEPDGNPDLKVFYSEGLSAAAVLPKGLADAATALPGLRAANVIADKDGHVIWRYEPPAGEDVSNFRTQTYQGRRVLTWWQGSTAVGHGSGADYIADEDHNIIAKVTPGEGYTSDVHEFRLTPDGRALITSYREVPADLTSIGGPAQGTVLDTVASVVDVATGTVLFRWSALDHVPLSDTRVPKPQSGSVPDPYHMNSIALDPQGNLVISLRDTSTVYDVDIHTGDIRWRLGGAHSTFDLGPGVEFAYQHDAEFDDPTTLRLFNNNSAEPTSSLGPSSVRWIHLDFDTRRATLVRDQTHPAGLTAFAMGNAQELPNGATCVGWGMAAHISEFSASGDLLYDARLPSGTYRAYLDAWP
ncbi:arylsulfotransferase family protein [Nocardia sp. NPDC004068]|uniref:arylsulfotransferase family protein n=1 Tax=Nocardia sp. NPDC004068 TaxID=3364303 RepID=UPI0036CB521B